MLCGFIGTSTLVWVSRHDRPECSLFVTVEVVIVLSIASVILGPIMMALAVAKVAEKI